jgi:hypothetical protein
VHKLTEARGRVFFEVAVKLIYAAFLISIGFKAGPLLVPVSGPGFAITPKILHIFFPLSSNKFTSVVDPECLSGIPDPDFYPFRIPDLGSRIQTQQQKRGVKKFAVKPFL